MKSTTKKIAKICLFISAVLCLALIAAQFLPYWQAPAPEGYTGKEETTTATTTEATTEATTVETTVAATEGTEGTEGTGATEESTEAATEETKKKRPGLMPIVKPEDEVIDPELDPISIFNFLILPNDHPYIEQYLKADGKNNAPTINSLAGTFCIVLLLGAVSIALVITKSDKRWISVFPTVVGVGSLIGYLTEPVWAMGSLHTLLIALSAALTAVSLIPFFIWIFSVRFWFMDPKKLNNK